MNTPKFAPGDEIVVIDSSKLMPTFRDAIGLKGKLKTRAYKTMWLVEIDGQTVAVAENEMEHALLVESPLWKALS